jgi:ubiquinol-cytochrome c reductase cytochrome b subunit
MGGLLQINAIWQLGPYKPSQVSAGSQPDFYMMWTEGLARIWPAWELYQRVWGNPPNLPRTRTHIRRW